MREDSKKNMITQPYMSRIHSKGLLPYSIEEGFDSFVTVLMVAEKPSIARSIAEALGGSGFTTRKGICKFTNVFTFYGSIFGKKAMIKVTSVIGHIYTTDFTEEFQDWRRVDPYKLFNAMTLKKETNADSQIIQHLQKEAMGASYLILWLDNDREGENICFEVLTACKPELTKEDFQQVFRAKFSSITPMDICQAYDELSVGPNLNESIAVDARQVIDLKVGVAFSRFQTRYLVRKYEDLNNKKITFGPCQTPTLAFCVQRDDEIKQFNSKSFYRIIPKISLKPTEVINLDWTKERTYDEEEATEVKKELEKIAVTTVTKADNKETQKAKPTALNTVSFLKLASRQYGIGPQQAMQVAEKLYLGGYITYPRTESTKYADRFDFQAVLNSVSGHQNSQISSYAYYLQSKNFQQSKLGKDVGDHPPITPTNKMVKIALSRDEANVYELVCRHFLASIANDCRLFKKKVIFQCGSQQFSLVGTAVIDKGFMDILPWQKIYENEIPNFELGDQIYLHSVEMVSGHTQAPEHLTESDLIGLMESNGIGTDASMAQHIANICERQYVTVEGQQRRLIPSELGIALIHAYTEIDPELVAPNLRSSIEKSVELIAQGQLDKDHVLQSVIELFKNKYLYFVSKVSVLDQYFDPIYQSIESTISNSCFFTKCGRCKSSMRLLEKIGKVFCEKCKFMYGLPRDSKFSVAGECYCPVDGFQLILVEQSIAGNIKRYTLCPLCFQKPPEFENYKPNEKYSRTSCNLCTNRSCQFSMTNNEVGACQHCKDDKGGRFVLDWPTSEAFTMSCNGCHYQHVIVRNGIVIRMQNKCQICFSYCLKIESNDGWRFIGCVFCDSSYRVKLEDRVPIAQQYEGESIMQQLEKPRYFNNDEDNNNNHHNKGKAPYQKRPYERFGSGSKKRFDGDSMPFQAECLWFKEKENSQQKRQFMRKPRGARDDEANSGSAQKNQQVDIVKRGIQKTINVPPQPIGPPATVQYRRRQNLPQMDTYTNSASQILLENSYQQDQEFLKKFPLREQSLDKSDKKRSSQKMLVHQDNQDMFSLQSSHMPNQDMQRDTQWNGEVAVQRSQRPSTQRKDILEF